MKNTLLRNSIRAFSLVEIVISVGIVSFAFVALMGMIPVGLSTFENSIDATMEAQISQRLFSEAQQANFSNLTALTADGRFYDYEGFPIGQGATAPSDGFVYHAVMNAPTAAFINNTRVRTITIDIGKNRTVEDLRANAPSQVRRFSFMVADVGA